MKGPGRRRASTSCSGIELTSDRYDRQGTSGSRPRPDGCLRAVQILPRVPAARLARQSERIVFLPVAQLLGEVVLEADQLRLRYPSLIQGRGTLDIDAGDERDFTNSITGGILPAGSETVRFHALRLYRRRLDANVVVASPPRRRHAVLPAAPVPHRADVLPGDSVLSHGQRDHQELLGAGRHSWLADRRNRSLRPRLPSPEHQQRCPRRLIDRGRDDLLCTVPAACALHHLTANCLGLPSRVICICNDPLSSCTLMA